mgnify:CR=1 FL=1|jgi:hypothetical protein
MIEAIVLLVVIAVAAVLIRYASIKVPPDE